MSRNRYPWSCLGIEYERSLRLVIFVIGVVFVMCITTVQKKFGRISQRRERCTHSCGGPTFLNVSKKYFPWIWWDVVYEHFITDFSFLWSESSKYPHEIRTIVCSRGVPDFDRVSDTILALSTLKRTLWLTSLCCYTEVYILIYPAFRSPFDTYHYINSLCSSVDVLQRLETRSRRYWPRRIRLEKKRPARTFSTIRSTSDRTLCSTTPVHHYFWTTFLWYTPFHSLQDVRNDNAFFYLFESSTFRRLHSIPSRLWSLLSHQILP